MELSKSIKIRLWLISSNKYISDLKKDMNLDKRKGQDMKFKQVFEKILCIPNVSNVQLHQQFFTNTWGMRLETMYSQ